MKTNSFSTVLFIAAIVISSSPLGKSLAQNVSSNQTTNQTITANQTAQQGANT
jgi:hypothetical protein